MKIPILIALVFFSLISRSVAQADFPLKKQSAFFPSQQLEQIRANAKQDPWISNLRSQVVSNAAPWMNLSDDELWDLMFGATIPRSWMVWSDGHCPACKKSVPMYQWKMDAWKHPWKTRCPQCEELFPKNDFHAFYKSGLDEHGVFNPSLADRKLLFNTEHPDPNDPLHQFGVDDGTGYVADGKRWRFIPTYLIFGQFHQKTLSGIDTLAAAFVLTGEKIYAHKAAILLDRVADLYPTFDFAKQGFVYENGGINGYISVWHDASEETYEMILAYDQIFEGLRDDAALVEFLSAKAKRFKLSNPKNSIEQIQRNIEGRILRDALANPAKIHSNFPRRECTEAAIHTVLAWPENRAHVEKLIDQFVSKATAVDGVTGEKGLGGYTAYTIAAMARFLNEYVRVDPSFLTGVLQRNPSLKQTYRFHIDTFCLGKYYPSIGDAGSFAQPMEKNPVLLYSKFYHTASLRSPLAPSLFSFYWNLYRKTGDPAYVQTLYRENNYSDTNLPCDIFEKNPAQVRDNIKKVIAKEGAEVKLGSIDKKQWCLALLRSGSGNNERVVTLDYDSGGAHGHADAMTLGLFAHGLDLLPDFGYPPVQFGGWTTPRANWYKMSGSHNTVVVDRRDSVASSGKTTLWADGKNFHAARVTGAGFFGGKQYERTAAIIDISPDDFYVLDIFRVIGGSEHTKFVHGHFADLETRGLALQPIANDYPAHQLKDFQSDTNAQPGWRVTWNIEDRHGILTNRPAVRMHYTDLSTGVEALTAKTWIAPAYYKKDSGEVWNPSVIVRRRGVAPLASTFVSVLEPFTKKSAIKSMRRLPLQNSAGETLSDAHVAVEIQLADGRSDLIIATDVENPNQLPTSREDGWLIQPNWNVQLAGEMAWLRCDRRGNFERATICRATALRLTKTEAILESKTDLVEFTVKRNQLMLLDTK